MGDDDEYMEDKTSVVASDTLKMRMNEANEAPPTLILLMGPAAQVGKQWPLLKTDLIIGRTPEAHIFVDDKSMSRKHAKISIIGNAVMIEDLGSSNGTEMRGQKLVANTPTKLSNNEQIKAGNVIFKFLEKGNLESVANQVTYDRTQVDPLTQVYNKGALLHSSEDFYKRARTQGLPLTVIVFDLDHFKNVNDTHGHQVGDFVLQELAGVIKNKLIRQGDFFARFGGEEFCLVLLGGDLRRGVEVAERIRDTIEKHDFNFKGTSVPVTISAGVATLELTMNSWDELFEKADQAAYLSKKGGRNRVSTI